MNLLEYSKIIPEFQRFLEAMSTPQPYWLRVNTLKIPEETLISRLEKKGFELDRYRNLNAYKIITMPVKHPGATLEHSLGYYYIQDLASMIPVLALNPEPGEIILDMTAAPGSKTTLMAEIMQNEGTIVANDLNVGRIIALAGNIERLGITNVSITRKNARSGAFKSKFDRILLDAPCTGEGIIRKISKTVPKSIRDHILFSKMQKDMLLNAYRHLKDKGVLVYSTCTFNPLENEGIVEYGIRELGFKAILPEIEIPYETGVKEWKDWHFPNAWRNVVRIYPHKIDTGGMFVAVLKK